MTINKRPGFEPTLSGNIPSYSVSNSSSTAIDNGSNFTGEWEEVGLYDSLVVAVATDQNGYYQVQFSPDGTNVDSILTRYFRTDLINPPHRFTVTRKYFRIRFFNDSGSNQTYFRLQVSFGFKQALNVPLGGIVSLDYDATVVRPTDYYQEAVLGLRQGDTAGLKFGYNDDIDSGAREVVASFGGTFTPLTSASTLTIVSDNANDTSAGTGARTLLISGINSSRRVQTEIVTLNGTTNVITANTWLGVNRIVVLSTGTAQQSNIGNISVTATTGGSNQARIPAGKGVTQQAIYFVQAGHNGLINNIFIQVLKIAGGTSPRVTVYLNIWNPGTTNAVYELRRFRIDTSVQNSVIRDYKIPLLLSPTDVCWFTAETDTNNTIVDVEFDLIEHRSSQT